jgi:lipoyl(octanoyl) transferase
VTYEEAWALQTKIHKSLIAKKLEWRDAKIIDKPKQTNQHILCEHSHVYTLGKSGSEDNLLIDKEKLDAGSIEFFKINRGGDITYHGPGQITGYPIFDLDEFFTDIHKYVRYLEEVIIRTIAEYGLEGIRIEGNTGVWLNPHNKEDKFRKICAIGVHLSRWVSMHGFAFNVNTDLDYFEKIIPCGIVDENKTVTSLSNEVGKEIDINEVKKKVKYHFAELFNFEYIN